MGFTLLKRKCLVEQSRIRQKTFKCILVFCQRTMSTHSIWHDSSVPSAAEYLASLQQAATYVRDHIRKATSTNLETHSDKDASDCHLAVVLGSGLMDFADQLTEQIVLDYSDIPNMPVSRVSGHSSKLVVGYVCTANNRPMRVLCFAGRVHTYEGRRPDECNFQVRMAHLLGVQLVLLTNSAGGALEGMIPGSCMIIDDFIRLTNVSPNQDVADYPIFGKRHVDSQAHADSQLVQLAYECGKRLNLSIYRGAYVWCGGPTYETHSEVRAAMTLNGGAFGMSTVPEIIAARALDMKVLAISMCTNAAAGLSEEKLSHEDVKIQAALAGPNFVKLLLAICSELNIDVGTPPSQLRNALGNLPQFLDVVPATYHALQRYAGWTPSLQQVFEASCVLRRYLRGQSSPRIAIFVAGKSATRLIINSLKLHEIVVMPMQDFPAMRTCANSSSGRNGQIILGHHPEFNQSIAIVSAPYVESFSASESIFLMQVLTMVGVCSLIWTGTAQLARMNAEAGVHLSIDFIDRSCEIMALPCHSDLLDVNAVSSKHAAPDALSTALAGLSLPKCAYVAFAGPMLPSKAELNIAHVATLNQSAIESMAGIVSVAPVHAARLLNLHYVGLCIGTTSMLVDDTEIFPDNIAVAFRNALSKVIMTLSAFELDQPKNMLSNTFSALLNQAKLPQTDHTQEMPMPVLFRSDPYNYVQAAAHHIEFILGTAKLQHVVMLESSHRYLSKHFQIIRTISASELPHFLKCVGDNQLPYSSWWASRWSMFVATFNNSQVLLVTTTNESSTQLERFVPAFHGLTFIARLSKLLHVRSLIMVNGVASASQSLPKGSLVAIRDHVAFAGTNPLFGENEPEFGERFPDMSGVYCQATLDRITESQLPIRKVVAAQLPIPYFNSVGEAKLLEHMHVDVAVYGMVPVSIVAAHACVPVVALCSIDHVYPNIQKVEVGTYSTVRTPADCLLIALQIATIRAQPS